MSLAWYIVFEKNIPALSQFVNGKALARSGKQLDAIAREVGVPPLMSFFGATQDELKALAEDHGLDGIGDAIAEESWFTAEEGLKTVTALAEALGVRTLDGKEQVLADLQEFEAVLRSAASNGLRWHLAVDF